MITLTKYKKTILQIIKDLLKMKFLIITINSMTLNLNILKIHKIYKCLNSGNNIDNLLNLKMVNSIYLN